MHGKYLSTQRNLRAADQYLSFVSSFYSFKKPFKHASLVSFMTVAEFVVDNLLLSYEIFSGLDVLQSTKN